MTSFSRILGQSWKVKFHKVKLLKFKTFNFDLKFCWNWSFFHYEKIMRFRNGFSYLEMEGKGRGIIIEVTRPLLLGPFTRWNGLSPQTKPPGVYKMNTCVTLLLKPVICAIRSRSWPSGLESIWKFACRIWTCSSVKVVRILLVFFFVWLSGSPLSVISIIGWIQHLTSNYVNVSTVKSEL